MRETRGGLVEVNREIKALRRRMEELENENQRYRPVDDQDLEPEVELDEIEE